MPSFLRRRNGPNARFCSLRTSNTGSSTTRCRPSTRSSCRQTRCSPMPDPLAAYPTLAEMQAVPLFAFLEMSFTDAGDGWAEITMLAGPGNQNLYGIVHGGAWLVVADSTMGGAFATVCAPDERIITGQLD